MKLRKGDEVVVLSGKDIGKRGTITQVIPEREKVIDYVSPYSPYYVAVIGPQALKVEEAHVVRLRAR